MATPEVLLTRLEPTKFERVVEATREFFGASVNLVCSVADMTSPHVVGDTQPLQGRLERQRHELTPDLDPRG